MLAWKLGTLAAAVALAAVPALGADDAQVIIVGSAQAEAAPVEGHAHGAAAVRHEYWLGLLASPPSPALQAQLKLPKDQGLLVESVQHDSPAAKAGVLQYDILLKGNDKPLANLADLLQLIEQVKDGKLKLELIRAGKHETVTVTPAKRPANEPPLGLPSGAAGGLIEKLAPSLLEGRPLEFRIIHPGQILPPGGPATALPGGRATMEITVRAMSKLADGSKVEITRHDGEPAKVVVTRDKEKWEGTSGDLSKIPEKIRPDVEKLLHPAFDHMRFLATQGGPGEGNALYFGGAPGVPHVLTSPSNVENRLGELQKQVDELRRSLDALQGKAKENPAGKPE